MNLKKLITDLEKAHEKLEQVDVSVKPSEGDLEIFNSLYEMAMKVADRVDYIIHGD